MKGAFIAKVENAQRISVQGVHVVRFAKNASHLKSWVTIAMTAGNAGSNVISSVKLRRRRAASPFFLFHQQYRNVKNA